MAESSRDKYAEKMADLQKHVPFIETMITHLKSTQEKSREAQRPPKAPKKDKADKSRDSDTKPLTNPTKPKEIPQTQDDGLVQVSSNSDEDDYNDMNHESSYRRQNFHYKNYSHRKYRPFTKAEASNQTVILPILLEAIKDGITPTGNIVPLRKLRPQIRRSSYLFSWKLSKMARQRIRDFPLTTKIIAVSNLLPIGSLRENSRTVRIRIASLQL
ncbi:hypothetical protein QE152_g34242 [Popillia japonica]|uniref:Reverse transcriptase domain-containing protein n=1 Tax=Popillia japonica TaxID=7064 RepID=A0AAW1IUI9_POPJA